MILKAAEEMKALWSLNLTALRPPKPFKGPSAAESAAGRQAHLPLPHQHQHSCHQGNILTHSKTKGGAQRAVAEDQEQI